MRRLCDQNKGFTLIELVVVTAIIALMSAAVFANYSTIDNRGKILAVTSAIKEDLHLAQNYALSGRVNNHDRANGWGIDFNRNLNKYTLFSDLNKDYIYSYPTVLLIHGTETVAAGSFNESSYLAGAVTVTGATQAAYAGKPADNAGFWSFDDAGDNLSVAATTTFDFAALDFAVDMWLMASSTGSDLYLLDHVYDDFGAYSFAIHKDASGKLTADVWDTNDTKFTMVATAALSSHTWYHLAVTRDNNMLRLFVNGVASTSTPITTALRSNGARAIKIGADASGGSVWDGLIDEVRVTRGNSRWVESFTPPAAAYLSDDEKLKEVKMPPGLAFERLYKDGLAVNELNVYFNRSAYLMLSNGAATADSAKIKINNVGAEGTYSANDSPKFLKIMPSGLVQWSAD